MSSAVTEPADSELLERFVRQSDETAFRSLVGRYASMVTGAALRRTGDVELSRDVAQRVFVTLARKAERLVGHARLGGWLYRTSSYEASRALQSETRRRRREQLAADAQSASSDDNAAWGELEDALAAMPAAQRELVVMHYFEDRSYAEMAGELGLTQVATRKRMSRALADLGQRLARKGVTAPASKLLLGAVAMQATLPAQKSLAAAALSAAATTTSSLLPTLMTSTTAKSCAAVLALAAVPLGLQWTEYRALGEELQRAKSTAHATASAGAAIATSDPALFALRQQVSDASDRLGELESAREAESERKREVERTYEQLASEFVISIGNVDAVAAKCAELITEMERAGQAELSGANAEEEGLKLIGSFMKMMPTFLAVASLDERPELNSRFYAGVIADALNLDDKQRKQIAAAMLPGMKQMKAEGLVISKRPESEKPPGESEWDLRHTEAAAAYARAVVPLMPEEALKSTVWPGFVAGEFASMLSQFAGGTSAMGGSPDLRASPPETETQDDVGSETAP